MDPNASTYSAAPVFKSDLPAPDLTNKCESTSFQIDLGKELEAIQKLNFCKNCAVPYTSGRSCRFKGYYLFQKFEIVFRLFEFVSIYWKNDGEIYKGLRIIYDYALFLAQRIKDISKSTRSISKMVVFMGIIDIKSKKIGQFLKFAYGQNPDYPQSKIDKK